MTRWFRFREDAVNDPELQSLPAEQFKIWVNLLCLANKNKGVLPPHMADIAWCIRESEADTQRAMGVFLALGLLESRPDGALAPTGWLDHKALRPSAAEWRAIRERIFERDDYTCTYCGARGVALQCDHVHPVAHGGGHDDDNLVTSCKPCNSAKRSKIVSIEQWKTVRGGGGS